MVLAVQSGLYELDRETRRSLSLIAVRYAKASSQPDVSYAATT
jgi:hypothetical protein